MTVNERAKKFLKLLPGCISAGPDGTTIEFGTLQSAIRDDPEAVAYATEKILSSGQAGNIGWSIWLVIANIFEMEFDDDSLCVLVARAAEKAGERLPQVKNIEKPEKPEKPEESADNRIFNLEIAEADLAAGDAHRMIMLMRLDTMPEETRKKLAGRCIITFPASGDDRPVQHIPRVRKFMADLHARMPYFPFFLMFHPETGMHLVYFGTVSDSEATELLKDGNISFDATHPSALRAMQTSVQAMVTICCLHGIDCTEQLVSMLSPYSKELRDRFLTEA